jgi:hypothetical protein
MSMNVQTSMRLPSNLLARADALIESLQTDSALSLMGKMTRSKVLRLALSEGLRVLETRSRSGTAPRGQRALIRAHAQADLVTAEDRISRPVSHPYTHSSTPAAAMEED